MSIFPNAPLQRTGNYFAEDSFFQKRWLPTLRPIDTGNIDASFLRIPADRAKESKEDDPDWRKNWYWILLGSTGGFRSKPLFISSVTAAFGMKTLLSLQTHLFAMRVGNRPVWVTTMDQNSRCHKPCYFNPETREETMYVVKYDVLQTWAQDSSYPITFI